MRTTEARTEDVEHVERSEGHLVKKDRVDVVAPTVAVEAFVGAPNIVNPLYSARIGFSVNFTIPSSPHSLALSFTSFMRTSRSES